MGNKDEFKRLLEIATQKDPNNADLQYNLGVIAGESDDSEAAKKCITIKPLELDPNYINAYINIISVNIKWGASYY